MLLGIKSSPNKDKLLETATGYRWECWLNEKLMRTRKKINLRNEVKNLCGCTEPDAHKHINLEEPTPIKKAASLGAFNLLKWRMGEFLSGYKKSLGAQNKIISVKNLCPCNEE